MAETKTPIDDDDEMMPVLATCIFFGGKDRPLNPSTLYRGIRKGTYPAPVHVGGNTSRWRRSECTEYRDKRMVEERDKRVAEQRAQQAEAEPEAA